MAKLSKAEERVLYQLNNGWKVWTVADKEDDPYEFAIIALVQDGEVLGTEDVQLRTLMSLQRKGGVEIDGFDWNSTRINKVEVSSQDEVKIMKSNPSSTTRASNALMWDEGMPSYTDEGPGAEGEGEKAEIPVQVNPKSIGSGRFVKVMLSKHEVEAFKKTWPASGLPDAPIWFQFDTKNGDLVDMGSSRSLKSADSSGALLALAEDAQKAIGGRPNPSTSAHGSLKNIDGNLVIRNPGVVDHIKSGDRVTIVDRFGQQHTGRAVMRSSGGGWVLNMGGRYGTPGIADEQNIVKVSKGRGKKNPSLSCPSCHTPISNPSVKPGAYTCSGCQTHIRVK